MAYYYKLEDSALAECVNQNLCTKDLTLFSDPVISTNHRAAKKHDFSKYILIEFLDDITPVKTLWELLGITKNKSVVRKRMMVDPHRLKCRRAVIICTTSESAREIVNRLKGVIIIERQICAVIIEDLLADIKLFEKQIEKYGDLKSQQKLVYVSNLNKCRTPAGLVKFLNEKFSPFGTILSVLVSEDVNGYALGEAVIRFSYFSEAFAAELAYNEFVIGKERLHVAMQHNILLCECDLRVRLRDGLKSYQSKVAAVQSFRPSVCSLPKQNLNSENKTCLKSTNTSATQNVQFAVNHKKALSDIHSLSEINTTVQQNSHSDSVEVMRSTPDYWDGKKSIAASRIPVTVTESEFILAENTFKTQDTHLVSSHHKKNCSKDMTFSSYKSANVRHANGLYESDDSENSNQSWSTKIFGWVKSFVMKDVSQDQPNCGSNQSSKDICENILYSNNYLNEDGHVISEKGLEHPVVILSADNISNKSNSHSFIDMIQGVQEIRMSNSRNNFNDKHIASVTSNFFHGCESDFDIENYVPENNQTSHFKSDALTTYHNKKIVQPFTLANTKDAEFDVRRTNSRKRCTEKSFDSLSSANKYNVTMRSKKKPIGSFTIFNQSENLSTLIDVNTGELISESVLSKRQKQTSKIVFSTVVCSDDDDAKNVQTKPVLSISNSPTELSAQLKGNSLLSSAEISTTLLHPFVSSTSQECLKPKQLSNKPQSSRISFHTNTDSSNHSSATRSSTKPYANKRTKNPTKKKGMVDRDSKLKHCKHLNKENHVHARLSPIVVSNSPDQPRPSWALSSMELEPGGSVAVGNSLDNPIRAWLKSHLFYSVNNRETSNEENPEGIVFATMLKDILISVGCSHMTCEVCYPGASDLIFGL